MELRAAVRSSSLRTENQVWMICNSLLNPSVSVWRSSSWKSEPEELVVDAEEEVEMGEWKKDMAVV